MLENLVETSKKHRMTIFSVISTVVIAVCVGAIVSTAAVLNKKSVSTTTVSSVTSKDQVATTNVLKPTTQAFESIDCCRNKKTSVKLFCD